MTTTQRHSPIKRKLTPIQKKREMVLTILDVGKTEIADAIGVSRQLVANIFGDRHRSLDVEKEVVKYLNKARNAMPTDSWENDTLLELNAGLPITTETMGWPKP